MTAASAASTATAARAAPARISRRRHREIVGHEAHSTAIRTIRTKSEQNIKGLAAAASLARVRRKLDPARGHGGRAPLALTAFGRPLTSRAWRCAKSSSFPTSGCGSSPNRSRRSTRRSKKLVEDMFETMYDAPGIGLAAIQVGVPKRIVTMDLSKKDERQGAARLHQSGDRVVVGREGDARGRLPLDPGILRGRRAAGAGAGEISRPRRQGAGDRGRAGCSRPACSTRSTTSTACCSSTTSPSSSATA